MTYLILFLFGSNEKGFLNDTLNLVAFYIWSTWLSKWNILKLQTTIFLVAFPQGFILAKNLDLY